MVSPSSQESQPLLDQATQIIEKQLPPTGTPDLGPAWPDWLICQILLREAKELFASTAPPPAPTGTESLLPTSN
jgi:hypothetical protein